MDVLARVAVPEGVLAKLLPPFTLKTLKGTTWLDCGFKSSDWASHIDWSESDAVMVHCAGHQVVHSLRLVGQRALGGAVLILELSGACVVVVEVIAAEFAL